MKEAVSALTDSIHSSEAYAEEAKRAGAVTVLTRLLKNSVDEEQVSLVTAAIASCSGPMACGGRVSTYSISQGEYSLRIKEGALGDGVGAKVWAAALYLCNLLAENPKLVTGRDVLEVGAGCGICGILAAKLSASSVTLSDYADTVLYLLRDCMHMNFPYTKYPENVSVGSVNSLQDDAFLQKTGDLCWEIDSVRVRYLDWNLSLHHEGSSNNRPQSPLDGDITGSIAPPLRAGEQFDLILGSEVIYEKCMAQSLPATLRTYLKPGGGILLCCAVRDRSIFDETFAEMKRLGFHVGSTQISLEGVSGGKIGTRNEDYEGGVLLIAAELEEFPMKSWHRDGLFV